MKRRDFIKTSACIGCAGALGACAYNSEYFKTIKNHIAERKFLYKNESELPKFIRLDICNLCQLNCVKCWIREDEELINKYGGGFGYVTFETFKDFIDKNPFIEQIELSNHGEMFLNPDLGKIIKYAYDKNVKLSAWTGVNLNTISEEIAEFLVKYKFEGMRISIDGASPETYAIYRRGGDFNKVISNIKMINKFKEKYNSPYPHMVYKMLIFGHNEHEIEKAKKLAEKLNLEVAFDENFFKDYSPIKDIEKVRELTGIKDFGDEHWKIECCKAMGLTPQINWNGDLFGCGFQHIKSFKIDVFKEGLLKSLNNEKYLYAKLMLSDYKVKPMKNIPCSDCYVYNSLKEKNIPINFNRR